MPPAGHSVEYAKSGRAKCQRCKQLIAKGALRLGQTSFFHGQTTVRWCCFGCFKPPKKLRRADELQGIEALREADRARVVAAVGGEAPPASRGEGAAGSDGEGEGASAPVAAVAASAAPSLLPTGGLGVSAVLPRGHGSNIPQHLWSSLYAFQREGVMFGLRVAGRVLIGDEMGLGKTLQGLALACAYRRQWPCLILAPASMCLQWADELEKWLPWLLPTDVNLVLSRDNSRLSTAPVSIMSYGMLTSGKAKEALVQRIADAGFQVVIADEAHYLKNGASARAKLILPVLQAASRTILLTGTPALNCPQELFSLVHTLDDVTFPEWPAYADRYCDRKLIFVGGGRRSWDTRGASHLPELHQKLSTLMVRRRKMDVLTQLPAKHRRTVVVKVSPADATKLRELRQNLEAADKDSGGEQSWESMMALGEMWRAAGLAKLNALKDYMRDLLGASDESASESSSGKMLVFAHHLAVLDEAQKVAVNARVGFIRIDGSTSQADRHSAVQRFQNDSKVRLAILSIKAAGQGLTMTAASTVVFAEMTWVPGELLQAEDRAHRIGQRSAVSIHYLIAPGSIDDIMWRTLERKVNTISETLDGKTESLGKDRITVDQATGCSQNDADDPSAGAAASGAAAAAAGEDDSAPSSGVTSDYCTALRQDSGAGLSRKRRQRDDSEAGQSTDDGCGDDGNAAKKLAKGLFSIFAKPKGYQRRPATAAAAASSGGNRSYPPGPWACSACSFLNTRSDRTACEICATKREAPMAATSATAPVEIDLAESGTAGAAGAATAAAAAAPDDGEGIEQELLLFAVSEHAGRVHVFRPPTASEATDAVTGSRPQPVKLCNFHPLELPPAAESSAAVAETAAARLPKEMQEGDRVAQAIRFVREWKQLTSQEQGKLTGRATRPPVRAALFNPPRLLRTSKQEWGPQHCAKATAAGGGGGAARASGEREDDRNEGEDARTLKRQATDGSTTRETNSEAWLQRHATTATAAGADANAAAVVPAGTGDIDVEVRTWTERGNKNGGTAKQGGSKSKTGKGGTDAELPSTASQREWQQAFERGSGRPCCVLCLAPYSDEQRVKYDTAFCSQACSIEFGVRSSQSTARRQLYAQQKGVCQKCGLDAHSLYETLAVLSPAERYQELLRIGYRLPRSVRQLRKLLARPEEGDLWQADHIVPVSGGGGECDLSNYQTLCTGCHEGKTAEDKVNVKLKKAAEGVSDIRSFFGGSQRQGDNDVAQT